MSELRLLWQVSWKSLLHNSEEMGIQFCMVKELKLCNCVVSVGQCLDLQDSPLVNVSTRNRQLAFELCHDIWGCPCYCSHLLPRHFQQYQSHYWCLFMKNSESWSSGIRIKDNLVASSNTIRTTDACLWRIQKVDHQESGSRVLVGRRNLLLIVAMRFFKTQVQPFYLLKCQQNSFFKSLKACVSWKQKKLRRTVVKYFDIKVAGSIWVPSIWNL